ncbi:MAG: SAM-dependent methyltransferase, partial [Planctomycetes bacterium]|nr:SAM-dependent methyltransferase [Planctomycetota bacterium]
MRLDLGRRDHLTFRGNVKGGRHGWLRLTPAYSLHVVEEILEDSARGTRALDPFSGSGTTPLACAALGIPCDAVEINPFLAWLGNVKLRRFVDDTAARLRTHARAIVAARRARRAWIPPIHDIEKWWDASTLRDLAAIRAMLANADDDVADLAKVAFCRTAIDTANVSFRHQSMSFRQRAALESSVASQFVAAADAVADSLAADLPRADARVVVGDSRALDAVLLPSTYSLVITSPPYPNRMSYVRELRPYMYWLGFLESGREAGELDWRAIGGTWGCATSNLGSWQPSSEGGLPELDRIADKIAARQPILGRYVRRYFEDVRVHLASLRRVLRPGARCHYVVGNSKFYDTLVPVERLYAALFEQTGFEDVSIDVIRKR